MLRDEYGYVLAILPASHHIRLDDLRVQLGIPVQNSYWLSANLTNAVLLTYPDSGHGSLFQFHESFTRQAAAFLASDSKFAPY